MKVNAYAAAVVILTVMLMGSMAEPAYAGFPIDARPATSLGDGRSISLVRYRCHCRTRRYHLYSGIPEASDTAPVYPAPRTGVTFRKLFDAGYL